AGRWRRMRAPRRRAQLMPNRREASFHRRTGAGILNRHEQAIGDVVGLFWWREPERAGFELAIGRDTLEAEADDVVRRVPAVPDAVERVLDAGANRVHVTRLPRSSSARAEH